MDGTARSYFQPAIVNWFRTFTKFFGSFPEDYLVFDVETTGLDNQHDLIVQLGYCEVENRRPMANDGKVLNWLFMSEQITPSWLRQRLNWTRNRVTEQGKQYNWTIELLAQSPHKPLEVLADFWYKISHPEKPIIFVAHNGWHFDVPFIENHLRKYLQVDYRFADNSLWDTGAIEKALQLSWQPVAGETFKSFAARVVGERAPGVKWSLDRHAIPAYNLEEKYGLDTSKAHTATFDAYACHCLFEEMRLLSEAAR